MHKQEDSAVAVNGSSAATFYGQDGNQTLQ